MTTATLSETATIGSKAAARILGLSHRAVLSRIAAGTLVPREKLEGRTGAYLFDRAEVEALAEAEQARA